jgi:alkylation response protein AidB-like acyl-CoA dehydrogenase
MNLDFTPEEQAFRKEVRSFVETQLPAAIRERVLNGMPLQREDVVRWHKLLHAKGWAGFNWPKQFGGTGCTPVQIHIFDVECAAAGAPRILPFGVNMVAPVIMAFGSPAQQQRFLPRILSFDDWWCQGYSEPGSGSDLGSLKTKAERKGDHYLVNGQKTWTTLAQFADWIFCLVRTDPKAKPQEGISFLLIDMKTPGITVKPIIMADGGHEGNEVFFDNVKVPVANLVGKENDGWTCAKFLLANERLSIAAVPQSKRGVEALKDIARVEQDNGKPLIENQSFAEKIADLEIQVTALEYTELRVLSHMAHGGAPGPEVSGLKIRGSEIQQRITELTMEAVGEYAAPYLPGLLWQGSNEEPVGPAYAHLAAPRYFNTRKTTIYGGSNEIQKGIISKMVLGL